MIVELCVFDILEKIIVAHEGYCSYFYVVVCLCACFILWIVCKNFVNGLCIAYSGEAAMLHFFSRLYCIDSEHVITYIAFATAAFSSIIC